MLGARGVRRIRQEDYSYISRGYIVFDAYNTTRNIYLEFKTVKLQGLTQQLRRYAAAALSSGGKFELLESDGTKISKQLLIAARKELIIITFIKGT